MPATHVFATILATASFISGAISLRVFYNKNMKYCKASHNVESKASRSDAVSARLPSLISIEIIILLWYLMGAIPLMLFFWFFLPTHHIQHNTYEVAGSIAFVSAFIPLFTTHIIRIWILKLKYSITSLSMLNQLGMVKWSDIHHMIWAQIYYKHKWTHNIQTLMIISITFDIVITIIYSILISINLDTRTQLNAAIFVTLTLILIIGVYSLKSFNDPFNIFREEIIILSVWFVALAFYAILYWSGLYKVLSDAGWTITATFFGSCAGLVSIIIHFHFNDKSIQTLTENPPPLSVIVSTKEGLETFLKFLVTELSVENLEFFTLSMRWRHRLVLRNQRKERNKMKLKSIKIQITDTDENKTQTDHEQQSKLKLPKIVNETKQNLSQLITSTSERLLMKNPAINKNETHLKQLPFPILTFEFLDKDVVKNTSLDVRNPNEPSVSDTSHVVEFSKSKSPRVSAQVTQREVPRQLSLFSPVHSPCTIPTRPRLRQTVVSIYTDQYSFMQENKRKQTNYLLSSPIPDENDEKSVSISNPYKFVLKRENKKVTISQQHQIPTVSDEFESRSFQAYDPDVLERGITARSNADELTANYPNLSKRTTLEITPLQSYKEVDDATVHDFDLCLSPIPDQWIKHLKFDIVEDERKSVVALDDDDSKRSAKNDEDKVLTFDNNFAMYNEEWTEEFMSNKTVDYDRFNLLIEEINVSFRARKKLQAFFEKYPTVKLFRNVQIAKYDDAFEMGWKNVWQNLNDSLRRFHQSKFFKEWLQSHAADGLNVNVLQMQ